MQPAPPPSPLPPLDLAAVALPDLPPARRRPRDLLARAWTGLCGAVGLLACLSALAAIPVLQLLTLGWLLEAEGRLGRGEGLRAALPGLARAARVGAALLGLMVIATPWLVLRGYARDAALLDPGSDVARELARWTLAVGALTAAHGALAVARGGRFVHFLRPLSTWAWAMRGVARGPVLWPSVAAARAWLGALRLPHYLGLGTQGLVAGFVWLALPTALLAAGGKAPGLALLGALLLVLVLPWLLAAQARLAAEGRFAAAFELGEVRRRLARAPLAHALALVVTLALALPLFLLKVEPVPRDALWLPAAFFLVAAVPGRLLAGWAHARAARPGRAHPVLRLAGAAVALPAGAAYVFVLAFSQLFSWYGATSLFAHHAFLLPVAFY
ncbi:MAG: hypothetical protein KF878_03715 [Planctomycetes bacterium]|nr:hypothetical protein [Planctomycetota bacterium]